MQVTKLWRYPVKSLGGQEVATAKVGPNGIAGDRHWGVVDSATGKVLTARRAPKLLFARAHIDEAGELAITLPDGASGRDDGALSAWLGSEVRLEESADDRRGTFETVFDFEHEDGAEWFAWDGPTGSFHDSAKAQVSIVSEATMGDWDPRRFRANVIVDGEREDDLVGHEIEIGGVRFEVVKPIDRCVMVTRPQPGIDRDLDVLRTISRERAGNLSVGARVVGGDSISVGDEVRVLT